MPASNERALNKAPGLDCDSVIFDLEDSLAEHAREVAHQNLRELVPGLELAGREKIVRLPEFGGEGFDDDLSAALSCEPDALLLPKVESPETIKDLAAMCDRPLPIWAMIETPMALVNLTDICRSGVTSGLECLVVGPNDLAKTTGARMEPGRAAMMPWLMQVLAAGRAYDLCVLDGVYNNFRDEEGLIAECKQGASMGYDGKTLIHPAQIEAANVGFGISEEDLIRAKRIVELFERPENAEKAVIQMDGEMIEHLHCDMARRLISAKERI